MKRLLPVLLFTVSAMLCFGQKPEITKVGDNNYKIRISPENFNFERVNRGNNSYAWAACLDMVLNNLGLPMNQDQLTNIGLNSDKANGLQDAIMALNIAPPGTIDRPVHVYCEQLNVDDQLLFNELNNNRATLAGIRVVSSPDKPSIILAMTFSVVYNNKGEKTGISPNTVTLADPAVGAQAISVITWSDFVNAAAVLYSVRISGK